MFDDLFADRQPQAGTHRFVRQRIAHLDELFKDFAVIFGIDASAGIDDTDDDIAIVASRAARNTALLGELDRVRNQIDDDLDQAIVVAGELRQIGCTSTVSLNGLGSNNAAVAVAARSMIS